MNKLVIATTNPGKFQQLRDALEPLNIPVGSLQDYANSEKIIVQENGKTAQENACIKATTYASELDVTVLAMDSSLYLNGLPDEKQPGIFVRRIYGEGNYPRPTDSELLAYYTGLITGLGSSIDGYWEFGICIATPNGATFETNLKNPRKFVDTPCQKMISGFPLESLQIEPNTGKYIAEMNSEEKAKFWQQMIGVQLCEFVQDSLKRKLGKN